MTIGRGTARLLALLLSILALPVLAGCGESATTDADGRVVLRYQGSPSQVLWPELAEGLGYFEKVRLQWIGDTTSGPQDIQSVATNQADFGSAFNGSVAKLRAAGAPITSVISVYGSDEQTFHGYYSLEGSGITEPRHLIGKKVGINTLGAYHEYTIKEWLHRKGLTDQEIGSIEFVVVPPINTERALREKQIDVGNLGTIIKDAALLNGGLHEIFRDTGLIGDLAIGTTVLRDDFIAKNREAVADFVQGTARALRWAQLHSREEVVAKFTEIIERRGRAGNTDFVRHFKSTGIPIPGGVIAEQEFVLWTDEGVRLGLLEPGIDVKRLFTNEFNPYSNGAYATDADENGGKRN
ncbi:ABC transporter substrate-binding protein [Nocardia bovistercoris]|uniref:ABC transporter substrate-binding protein n=1 Tax=Nocardia bovistercoris TaxID=2785916 RepID=A0A931I9A3_9NOCA|nr:ABC transporter substrate-binding protein [Nocardia bovistercoris]MBH0776263.1 ABC transporter substrate-binding protein [Nocardia bovistercoris]